MALHRTQILLEPEQHRALTELARREKRSLSDLVRDAVQRDLDRRREKIESEVEKWRAWFDEGHELSARILARRGGKRIEGDPAEMLRQLRDERDDDIMGIPRGQLTDAGD